MESQLTRAEQALTERIKQYDHKDRIASVIVNLAKSWGNKQMNKRFATALEQSLNEGMPEAYIVSWNVNKGSFNEVKVWGNGLSYSDNLNLYLGWDNAPTVEKIIEQANLYRLDVNEHVAAAYDQARYELANLAETVDDLQAAIKAKEEADAKIKSFSYTLREALGVAR